MTDHLLEAREDMGRRETTNNTDWLVCAVGHILDHLEAQQASPEPDPLDETNHDDRYDHDGSRWWWCDKCGGFRLAVHHTVHSSSYGWPATKINEPYGPLTFAPQPTEPPTAARTERHIPPETWEVRLAWLGDEAIGSDADSGFDIWLEIHDADVSARALRNAAKELEAQAEKIREGLGSLLHGAGGDPGRRHDQDRIRELGRQAGWLQARADNIAQGEKP